MFIISYVVVTVKARLIGFDRHLEEAAMDLGANEWTTFRKVTLPLIAPAVVSGALLGFAISLDDFVITYFNAGSESDVPRLRLGSRPGRVPPQVNVIASAIFLIAIAVALANVLWQYRAVKREKGSPPMSVTHADLQKAAKEHLWMHFTRMGGYESADVPIIVRGEGCYLEDVDGKRYLDALAGLFSVNIGYSFGEEIGQAALEQMRELPFYTNWSYAHPRAIELAAEIASLAPGDLERVFFCSGGSEAVESAWKLARQFYVATGSTFPRYKAIARRVAYHGTTFGALTLSGIPGIRELFEPLLPEVRHVSNTNRYHRPPEESEEEFTRFLLDELEQTIVHMGRRPSASCTWSPCRTRAARSCPRPVTGRECARSATGTGSCSPRTR